MTVSPCQYEQAERIAVTHLHNKYLIHYRNNEIIYLPAKRYVVVFHYAYIRITFPHINHIYPYTYIIKRMCLCVCL